MFYIVEAWRDAAEFDTIFPNGYDTKGEALKAIQEDCGKDIPLVPMEHIADGYRPDKMFDYRFWIITPIPEEGDIE